MYQIEQQHVEQESIMKQMRSYVEGEALSEQIHKVEFSVFKLLLRLGLSLLKEVVARRGNGKCGSELRLEGGMAIPYHSEKKRSYLSIFGWVEITRAYYWQKGETGCYPLDEQMNLPQRAYSYLLDQWVDLNVIDEAYDKGIAKIARIFDLEIWKRGQEDVVQEVAVGVRAFYQQKAAPQVVVEGPVLCATADCKGVRMVPSEKPEQLPVEEQSAKPRREKGDKRAGLRRDAVVTSDFSFIPQARTAEELTDALMKMRTKDEIQAERETRRERKERGEKEPRSALNKQVMASMQGKEVAFKDLLDRLHKRDPEVKKQIFILLDGAPSLKERLLEEIQNRGWEKRIAGICLDIIHVQEYLWDAGTALHGEKSPERVPWVREKTLALLQGKVGRVIGGLRQILTKGNEELKSSQKQTLNRTIKYFDNHREMMEYDKYLAAGYPIATGVIEGACNSLVKDRTDGSGMRWTKAGAQAVLDLRAVHQNEDWDAYWQYHIQCEHDRRYARLAS
jgi:hypothetical protein